MAKMVTHDVIDARADGGNFASHKNRRERPMDAVLLAIERVRIAAARKIIRYAELAIN
ncbi:hypothetical protein [Ralstonia sp. 1B3]|uniref:hypothetical protein n=1 Tax=Ralstonia sp. 1B3 TaxID=2997421 RepID=UPI002FC68A59